MFDIEKQINYWTRGAENDVETAELLISGKKYLEGLFFCHLTIEKIVKALVVKKTGQLAPKSHNLGYLSALANLELAEEHTLFMAVLMKYQLEGRYPEYYPKLPSIEIGNEYFMKTKLLLECLRSML
ncbi:MAG: HEPN domain-containing protein [Bacteroidota bacterium]|nr:HEPN domain-containing protein [Bacteroidota bacterium]